MKYILPITILLVLLVLACGPKQKPTPTLTAQEVVQRCVASMEDLDSFHFELEQSSGSPIAMGLELVSASGDIARPGRLKLHISATMGSMALEVDIITVGEKTYMTNPLSGQWEPLPTEFNAIKLFDPDTGIRAIIGGITSLTKLADEEVSGTACYHIKGTLDSSKLRPITCGAALEGVPIDTELWIGKEDFLLRQVRIKGQITEGEEPEIVRTLRLSQFNQPVSIELPE